MAKITNTSGSSNIWLGSHKNARQTVLYVPGAITANKPGLLFLESTDGTTPGGLVLWADSSNNLRYHTSIPSNEATDGNILDTSSDTNAHRDLSNLASTKVNVDIIPNTDSNIELGSSGKYWKEAYVDKIYLTSSCYMSASTADLTLVGDLSLSEGMINIDSTTAETSYIKQNNADSTTVFEVEATHTSHTGVAVLIDQNGTGNSTALQISHDGDYPVIDIDAGAARTGNVIDIAMANQEAEMAILINGAATGTSGEGIVSVDVSGTLAGDCFRADTSGANAATSALFKGIAAGNQGAATNGITAYFTDTGTASGTSYTVYIASTENEALYVDTGKVVFDENLTIAGGGIDLTDGDAVLAEGKITVASTADETSSVKRNQGTTNAAAFEIEITSADDDYPALLIDSNSDGDADAVVIETLGSGYGVSVQPALAAGAGFEFQAHTNATAPGLLLDGLGTPGPWLGDDGVGMLQIQSDGTLAHAAASLLAIIGTGGAAAASATGSMLRIVENASEGSGYAVYIASTGNLEALHIDDGAVVFDETLTVTGTLTQTGAATFTAGSQNSAVARTATELGDGDAIIAAGTSYVSVTTTDDAYIIVLPTAIAGNEIWLMNTSATKDFELKGAASDTINGGAAAGTSTIAEATLVRAVASTAVNWVVSEFTAAGVESATDAST